MTAVAVVVLTHNRLAEVAGTVARMRALPERPRLVVVDNASTDGTAPALERLFPDVTVVALPRNLGAAGRNEGVRRAEAPYVALCDDDTWWAPGSLAHAARLLDEHPRLGLVTGRVLVGDGGQVDPTCVEMAASPLAAHGALPGTPVLGFLAASTVVRRSAFLEVGGFEPRFFLGGEERLLAIDLAAAGWRLAYVDEIVVHHHPSKTRDARSRRQLVARNDLWCAWLRRPVPSALRETARILRRALDDPGTALGAAAALAGLPWVLRHRRAAPPDVEQALRLLEVAYPARRRSAAPST